MIVSVARGDGPFGWLGQRSGTFHAFHPSEIPKWFVFLAVGLVLYVAVLPAVATAIMCGRGLSRSEDERARLFAAVTLPTIGAMLLCVAVVSASFDVDQVGNLNERYVFYIVPLAFVGMALWIESGLPRPRPWSGVALTVACVAPVLLPIRRLDYNAGLQALALVPWGTLAPSAGATAALVAATTLCFALVWMTCSERTAWRLWTLIAVWMALLGLFAVESNRVSASRTAAAFDGRAATWIDDALPQGVGRRGSLGREAGEKEPARFLLLLVDGDRVLQPQRRGRLPARTGDVLRGLPSNRSRAPRSAPGRSRRRDGRPVRAEYALVTCRTPIRGEVVAPRAARRSAGSSASTAHSGCRMPRPADAAQP